MNDLFYRIESVPMSLLLTRTKRPTSTLDTVCVWGSLRYVAPQQFGSDSSSSPCALTTSCTRPEMKGYQILEARSEHDEGGACLLFMIDPLTFIWVYIISEHKINFSGEVGQIKQLVPVFFSGSLWTTATPQNWALLHAICLHISWKWVWIYNILQGNKNKWPNPVITLIWCHLGFLYCIYDV